MSDREGKVIPSRIIRHLPGPPMPTGGTDFSVEWDDEFVVARPRLQASATAELAAALGCRLEHGQLLRDGTGEDDAHQLSLELVERGYTVGLLVDPAGSRGLGSSGDAARR